jgi:hypothetical protein
LIDPIEGVMDFAAKYDILIDKEDARLFLENRATLAINPSDPEAQRIAQHFRCMLYFAKDSVSFSDFVRMPECPPECPECGAHNDRYRDHVLNRLGPLRGASGAEGETHEN